MKHVKTLLVSSFLFVSGSVCAQTHQWTLQECLDYALENNIQLKQKTITTKSSMEDVTRSKSALLPTVSFSTSQNMNYRPFSNQTVTLDGGTMSSTNNAVSYNGTYGLNARWNVWDGNKSRLAIRQNEMAELQNEFAEEELANSIQEQITNLYVQILYETEAIKVSKEVLNASKMQLERAKTMVETGNLAKVDQIQLEAQVAQDELSVVSAESMLENYKLQMKQLLEIHDNESFDIASLEVSDEKVLSIIPEKSVIYNSVLENRPEIKAMKLNIENSELSLKSANAGYFPTIAISGGLGTSNAGAQNENFGTQIKNNLSYSMGVSVSVPIFDNNDTRTNIRKAKYAQESAQLQLQDAEKQLYSNIENCYLDASTSQQKYIYAKKNVESMKQSYELVSEQFRLGLKNIVELTTSKNNLLQAEQQLLETKYTALYNLAILRFYQGEKINL